MAKANQRSQWERGNKETVPPSRRTAPKGIKNKYSGMKHNHFPQGKTGFIPQGVGQPDLSILKR